MGSDVVVIETSARSQAPSGEGDKETRLQPYALLV
jgi:hypothetical protein